MNNFDNGGLNGSNVNLYDALMMLSQSISNNDVVGNWIDDNEDKFIDEDAGDVNSTVLLLFVVDLLL